MKNPIWMYRRRADGDVEARLFDAASLPRRAEGWRDSPAALPGPFAGMSKKELEAYVRTRFGIGLDRRRSLSALRRQVQDLSQRARRASDGNCA